MSIKYFDDYSVKYSSDENEQFYIILNKNNDTFVAEYKILLSFDKINNKVLLAKNMQQQMIPTKLLILDYKQDLDINLMNLKNICSDYANKIKAVGYVFDMRKDFIICLIITNIATQKIIT